MIAFLVMVALCLTAAFFIIYIAALHSALGERNSAARHDPTAIVLFGAARSAFTVGFALLFVVTLAGLSA